MLEISKDGVLSQTASICESDQVAAQQFFSGTPLGWIAVSSITAFIRFPSSHDARNQSNGQLLLSLRVGGSIVPASSTVPMEKTLLS